jgi:hypothetical protein
MSSAAQRRFATLFISAAALALPAAARATVVWTATMEKGDLSEWTSQTNGTKALDGSVRANIEASTERAYSGRYSCKVTVHPDDDFGQYHQDRADTKHVSTLTGEGKDSWLSGYYFLPEDAKTRDEFGFYETVTPGLNWMDVWVEPKAGGGTAIKLGIESNGAILGSVLIWTGDFSPARWHQVAFHVHWSTDPTKGLVDFWLDGKQVVTAFKHQTKPNTRDLFFQTGLHRVLMQPYTESIYFDDFIESDTQDEAKIMAANPDGAGSVMDGGADAASAAGMSGSDASGAAGATGAAGAAGAGAAGASGGAAGATTGAAGSATGAAGSATGAAGSATGSAGTTGASGAAGMTTTVPSQGHGSSSSGCSIAGTGGYVGECWLAAASALAIWMHRRRIGRRSKR